ncbi:MAG: prolyl oligopeptidase family serine peptidase [Methylococcus sp.]|nr:prolyl oligopeptidase family serine peptidase [Methylococcus sp.]
MSGLTVSARVFVLNKRFMSDRSIGIFDCGNEFNLANNPSQWLSDYSEFIAAQLGSLSQQPKNVVMVGVSEGGLVASKIAAKTPAITHLAIIGYGGYSVRQMYKILEQKGQLPVDVGKLWKEVPSDPRSIEKSWNDGTYRWWSDMMDIDPLPDFLKLNIPVIVGVGEKDELMPVESALFLDEKFKEAGKDNLILKVYPESDHRLNGNGVSHRNEFFSELSRLLQPKHNLTVKRDGREAARPITSTLGISVNEWYLCNL